jgi:hypothetical protein
MTRRRMTRPSTTSATASAGGTQDEPHRKFPGQDAPAEPENGTSPVFQTLDYLKPAPENTSIYRPVDRNDPAVRALAESIRKYGVLEPLVVSEDGYILSGHRRYAAAQIAGLEVVPCRVEPIRRDHDIDAFVVRLREYNRQRDKDRAERLREEIVSADPTEAYQSLLDQRKRRSRVHVGKGQRIDLSGEKQRSSISDAKLPMLNAAIDAMNACRDFWPLSIRQVFYRMLNDPPLRHANKPDSLFRNDRNSYKDLSGLLVRARLVGWVPMHAIHDETRPVAVWNCFSGVGPYLQAEVNGFLQGYWRDRMQSQENHFEIVAEKLTVKSIVEPVAMEYCIPLTIGRGYSSIPARDDMVKRFRASGKSKLVLIMVGDHDPDGETIVSSFAQSLRDDFGVPEERLLAVKAAITARQVKRFRLPRNMDAKKTSSNYRKFVESHGSKAFELEALSPEQLQTVLRETIDSLIDADAFNDEVDSERADAGYLLGVHRFVLRSLSQLVDPECVGEDEEEPR